MHSFYSSGIDNYNYSKTTAYIPIVILYRIFSELELSVLLITSNVISLILLINNCNQYSQIWMIEANQQDLNQKQIVKNLQKGPVCHDVCVNASLSSEQKFQDISGSGMINHQSDSLINDSRKKRSISDIFSCIWNIFQSKQTKKETQPQNQGKRQKIQNMIKKKEYVGKSFYNKEYQDDDKIMKISQKYEQSKIELQVKAQRSLIRMRTKTDLPAMISLKTSGGSRVGIDLVCIIDVSGSMDGQKIQLVKKTLLYILGILGPQDRLSIVKFQSKATRVCGLVNTNDENRTKFLSFIDSLVAGGSTNILEGLQFGLKVLVNRKEQNLVTAIFMLSDGQDNQSVVNEFQKYQTCPQIENIGVYSLHTFGFGRDHNELIMSELSRIKDGSFYYISNPQDLGISFVNAIGGIISVISKKVKIEIKEISEKIAEGIKIKKVYGGMWKKLNSTCYQIDLLQLSSGLSKDFVFQLQIPCIKKKVNDFQRDQKILEVNFISIGVDNIETVGKKILILTILNENEKIPDSVENVDVIQNFLRVRTAQSIANNQEKADDNKFQQAEKGLDEMMAQIRNNRNVRKQYADMLANDIKRMKQKCNKKVWKIQGKKISTDSIDHLSSQTCFSFQNQIQRTLTKNLTEDKIRETKFKSQKRI